MSINKSTLASLVRNVSTRTLSVATATSNALATEITGNEGVRLSPDVDCYITFGDSNVTTTLNGHFLFGGSVYDFPLTSLYVAAMTASGTGNLRISIIA